MCKLTHLRMTIFAASILLGSSVTGILPAAAKGLGTQTISLEDGYLVRSDTNSDGEYDTFLLLDEDFDVVAYWFPLDDTFPMANPAPGDDSKVEPNLDAIKELVKKETSGEIPVDFWKTQFGKDLTKIGKGNPINPVHNPGIDDPNGGISADINNYDPFEARKEFEAYVEEARDLIDQATRHDPQDREELAQTFAEMMASENRHASLMEQVMPSNEDEDDSTAKEDDIERLMESVKDKDDWKRVPEAVNPDPTTHVLGSAVGAHVAKLSEFTSSLKQFGNPVGRRFGSAFDMPGAKLTVSKPLPTKVDNPAACSCDSRSEKRAMKLRIPKPSPKPMEKSATQTSKASFHARTTKLTKSKPLPGFAASVRSQ